MKKIISILAITWGFVMLFTSTTFAMSSIVIKNAPPSTVKAYLIKYMSSLGENITIETITDNSLTFNLTRTNFDFWVEVFTQVKDASNRISFTFTPDEEGTLLTYNAQGRAHTHDGREMVFLTSDSETERTLLERIKFDFDGGYAYGFSLSNNKKDGGFPIDIIVTGGPAEKSGLKVGDIVTKVNGTKIKYDKKRDIYNFHTTFQEQGELLMTVKRGKTEEVISVKSAFFDPKTQQFLY